MRRAKAKNRAELVKRLRELALKAIALREAIADVRADAKEMGLCPYWQKDLVSYSGSAATLVHLSRVANEIEKFPNAKVAQKAAEIAHWSDLAKTGDKEAAEKLRRLTEDS